MINLAEFQKDTQSEVDDASSDHLYVSATGIRDIPSVFGCYVDHTSDDETRRRLDVLKFAAVGVCRSYRANGGIGRPMVYFRLSPGGFEVRLDGLLSSATMFDDLRRGEAWSAYQEVFPPQ